MGALTRWLPATILGVGCLLNLTISAQRSMPLVQPLTAVPAMLAGHRGSDVPMSEEEARVAGVTSFLNRVYDSQTPAGTAPERFFVYVGYYPSQRQGRTIHSPKNCLPGAGWEPLESHREEIPAPQGRALKVNRFLIANKEQRAVVYYWYQGRGRTESSEYRVKLDLIRDSALRHRSEEALVRIVVPVTGGDSARADRLAREAAADLYRSLVSILPS